jgi:hypothetical protein
LQLQTEDYVMIGRAPRYLVQDLAAATRAAAGVKVVRADPVPAPAKQRLLVELRGDRPDEPRMRTEEFEPLAA